MHRNTSGVNLREARIGEERALFIGFPSRPAIAVHGIGTQEINIPIATGAEQYGMGRIAFQLAGNQVAANDPAGMAFLVEHQIHHLATGIELHAALGDFAAQSPVSPQQQLLPGLAFGIEGTRNLRPAERTVVQITGVIAGKRHALRHALVDDIVAHFSQTIDIGLTGAVVAPLDGIVKQTVNAVAIVLIVLGGIDTPLGGNRVRPARTIGNTENLHIEA